MTRFKRVTGLGEGRASADGSVVGFKVYLRNGDEIRLSASTRDVSEFVAFLADLAQQADRLRPEVETGIQSGMFVGVPITPLRVSCIEGDTPQETILAFHTGAFALAVLLPRRHLPETCEILRCADLQSPRAELH